MSSQGQLSSGARSPKPSRARGDSPFLERVDSPVVVDAEKVAAVVHKVTELVAESGLIPTSLLNHEIAWFFDELGIDDTYFVSAQPKDLADHILAIYGAKVSAKARRTSQPDLSFRNIEENRAVFFHTSNKGLKGSLLEVELDDRFLDDKNSAWRLETYRSVGKIADEYKEKLRCYFLTKCTLPDPEYHNRVPALLQQEYNELLAQMAQPQHRGVAVSAKTDGDGCRILIAYKRRTARRFFSGLSDLYHYYDLYSARKYVEPFDNGISIITLCLAKAGNKNCGTVSQVLPQVLRDISLLYVIPDSPLHHLFREGKLSIQEVVFAYCGGIFAQHFFVRLGPDYDALKALLNSTDVHHMTVLEQIRQRFRASTMRERQIWDMLSSHPEVLKELYTYFSQHHLASASALSFSAQSSPLLKMRLTKEEVLKQLREKLPVPEEFALLQNILTFADSVLKTNFFKTAKTGLSFRLDASFLRREEFPDPLYGLFMVVGSEFRAFHLRFSDIARGGIRVIQSRNAQVYEANVRTLFDENYNLAHTQQRKNKDIPEGGAKGTILMREGATSAEAFVAFKKYISGILDLLEQSPEIVDRLGKQEILFFGPDEGTAEYMDWAAQTARKRGFTFWKALTTGKSPSIGGIPHDLYGMTTRSIHQYVLGTLSKLGLKEEEVTKFQTGGPDGDLGSNEIKISLDKTIAIVDGSGVLYDPNGIDKEELVRLATARKMVDHFDISKLKKGGFRVLVNETNILLPDGTPVASGLQFRNDFHLSPLSSATLFVPCGGRPEAVNIRNIAHMYDAKGQPRFKAIIEGANLFFSEQARLQLEAKGVILFKDASANKGGVTSSSMEVLGALALNDEQYLSGMCVDKEGKVPEFRAKYVEEVIRRIELNARMEFDCLWREHQRTKEPISILSNKVSLAINALADDLAASELWNDGVLRRRVLTDAIPAVLVERVGGLDVIEQRVPVAYLQAIFSSSLASQFVYQHGIEANQLSFYTYLTSKMKKSN